MADAVCLNISAPRLSAPVLRVPDTRIKVVKLQHLRPPDGFPPSSLGASARFEVPILYDGGVKFTAPEA